MKAGHLVVLTLFFAAIFAWLAFDVASGRTQRFDLDVRETVHRYATPPLTAVMRAATFVGRAYAVLPLTMAVFIVLWKAGFKHKAKIFALAMAGEPPIEVGLKWAFHRPRPEPFFGAALPSTYSFPSGHALSSLIFYGTLAALLTSVVQSPGTRLLLWIAAAVMIADIGMSRIYLGVHYPTDVLAGYTIGLVWVLAIAAVRSKLA